MQVNCKVQDSKIKIFFRIKTFTSVLRFPLPNIFMTKQHNMLNEYCFTFVRTHIVKLCISNHTKFDVIWSRNSNFICTLL